MTKLISGIAVGVMLAAGGSAQAAQQQRATWSCPQGSFPDPSAGLPNCNLNSPPKHGQLQLKEAKPGAKLTWSCPPGSQPNPNAPLPNCAHQEEGAGALSQNAPPAGGPEAAPPSAIPPAQPPSTPPEPLSPPPTPPPEAQREPTPAPAPTPPPETPAPAAPAPSAEAQAQGQEVAPKQEVALEKRVEFKTDSAKIAPAPKGTLDEVASSVKSDPSVKTVIIEGHADNTGTPEVNDKISAERAQAVKDYLTNEGVPSDKIQVKSFGAADPVASNDSTAGRAINRSAVVIAVK